jgi:threonine aldolase
MRTIDLRSDTLTKPYPAMRAAIAQAEVGDDVFGEDPTVNRLQELGAELLGTEAALFVPSGTQSNLIALLTHCERGDEYIVGQTAHTYRYEGGGASVLGSIQPQPLDFEADGTLNLDRVAEAIKPKDFHFARTRLLCLENTQEGKVLPMDYLRKAHEFAGEHDLKMHLDGARIFNAAVKLKTSARDIARDFDSISVCLSKGLGAPVGSLLCSTTAFINEARRWRKVLGGGMRQSGLLAAAGIFALENNIQRLEQDHLNAALLAKELAKIPELRINPSTAQTNMVFIEISEAQAADLPEYLKQKGILIQGGKTVRLVMHMDVITYDIHKIVDSFQCFFSQQY